MLAIINEVALHLGRFYLAAQVLRDSGFHLYDPEAYMRYFFNKRGIVVPEREDL